MTDKFIAAVEELGLAISSGETIDTAIEEIAAEHGLKPEALRTRAERSLGELTTYRERHTATAGTLARQAQERRESERRWEEKAQRMREWGEKSFTAADARAAEEFFKRDGD